MPLTKRQREILNYLTAYSEQKGYAPSFEEIADNFNYNSLATVHEHLSNLERKGYIKRSYNESRAIQILPTEAYARAVELLMLGSSATVKKIYRERDGRIRLQPANESMEPIFVHENDISIQGVVVGVLR